MDIILIFGIGPILYLVSLVLPKARSMALIYWGLAIAALVAWLITPPSTSSDAAGNGLANAFAAIMALSAIQGLIWAGIVSWGYAILNRREASMLTKLLLCAVGMVGATFSMFLFLR
jgi:hypothetical protein